MRFKPMNEQEIQDLNLAEDGDYQFKVVEAQDKTSTAGNDMIALKLIFWDKNGRERLIFDWIMNNESMLYKLKHFCDSTSLSERYENGMLNSSDCIDKGGIFRISKRKDNRGEVRNFVKDYLIDNKEKAKDAIDPDLNDDVPF